MALIECTECNKQISNKANACPGCGAPLNTNVKDVAGGVQKASANQTAGKFIALLTIIAVSGIYATSGLTAGAVALGIGTFIAVIVGYSSD